MPYITQKRRKQLMETGEVPATPGELNYLLTLVVTEYCEANGGNYTAINDVVGALECCKAEFYRRVAVPYEKIKRKENGDVY